MAGRLLRRRAAAAAGSYSAIVLGFAGTVVAARLFTTQELGLYTLVIASVGFFQALLDLTIEALIKYGFVTSRVRIGAVCAVSLCDLRVQARQRAPPDWRCSRSDCGKPVFGRRSRWRDGA